MKSIVFCNIDDDIFNEKLRPIFDQNELEIIIIIKSDREIKLPWELIDEIDLVIIFQDMALKTYINIVKTFAKKNKKPCYVIAKRCSNLSQELSTIVKKLNPSVSSIQSSVNFICESVTDNVGSNNSATVQTSEGNNVPTTKELLDIDIINELQKSILTKDLLIAEQNEMISLFEIENDKLTKKLRTDGKFLFDSSNDNRSLNVKVTELTELVQSLKQQISDLQKSENNRVNILQEIIAIRDLNNDGLLSDADVLERFFLIGDNNE